MMAKIKAEQLLSEIESDAFSVISDMERAAKSLKKFRESLSELPTELEYDDADAILERLYFSITNDGFNVSLYDDNESERHVKWMELIYEPPDLDELTDRDIEIALECLKGIRDEINALIAKAESKQAAES